MTNNVNQMRKILDQLNESMLVNHEEIFKISGNQSDDYWTEMAYHMSNVLNDNVTYAAAEYDEKSRVITFDIETSNGLIEFKLLQNYDNNEDKHMPFTGVDIDFEFLEDDENSKYSIDLGYFPIDDVKILTNEIIGGIVSWAEANKVHTIIDYFS